MKNADGTVGRQSPRWAFMEKFSIPCRDGLVYLFRLRVVQTPWFGIYVHDIFEPDGDRDPHNHPWSFVSIILRGSYTEKLFPNPGEEYLFNVEQTWRRWSAHRMGRDTAHRIIEAAPGLKTLILTGPRRSDWGFFVRGEFVPWQRYVDARDNGVQP